MVALKQNVSNACTICSLFKVGAVTANGCLSISKPCQAQLLLLV